MKLRVPMRGRVPMALSGNGIARPSLSFDFANNPTLVGQNGGDLTLVRATTATFDGSNGLNQGAAANIARFAYSPSTLASLGLLVEPAATQLVTPLASVRDMTNAAWAKSNMSAVKTAVGSDGVANGATTITATAINATIVQNYVLAASSRTNSALVKRRTGTGVVLMIQNGVQKDITALINTSTYSLVDLNASQLNPGVGFQINVSGDALDIDFNQYEAGAAATSRIPEAITTRDKDVYSRALGAEHNQTAGTFFVDFIQPVANGANQMIVSLDDGTTSNFIIIYFTGSSNSCLIFVGGAQKFEANIVSPAAGTRVKIAFAWAVNDGAAYQNNVAMSIGTAGTTLPTVNSFKVGSYASGINQLGSTIAKVRYYPARLPNAQAQALTA